MPDAIDISVPSGPHFIHSAFVTAARELWRNPLLLCVEGMSPYQKFKQHTKFQNQLTQSVLEQVRTMLPTANILNNLKYGIPVSEEDHMQQSAASVDLRRQDLNQIMPSSDPFAPNLQQPNAYQQQPEMEEITSSSQMPYPQQLIPSAIPLPLTTTTTVTTAGPPPLPSAYPGGMNPKEARATEEREQEESSSDEEEDETADHENDEEKTSRGDSETENNGKENQIINLSQVPSRQNNADEHKSSHNNVIRIDTGV